MVLMPKKTKYRKQQKGNHTGICQRGTFVEFGEYGIQAMDRGRISAQQIEACRVAINRYCKRRGKVWIRIFPHKPITKKPAETRMGKGKGAVDHWAAVVKPGMILFEVGSVSRVEAQDAFRRAAAKVGIRTKFVERVEKV